MRLQAQCEHEGGSTRVLDTDELVVGSEVLPSPDRVREYTRALLLACPECRLAADGKIEEPGR